MQWVEVKPQADKLWFLQKIREHVKRQRPTGTTCTRVHLNGCS
jgi:hypothetical protein